jgi:hypothetical protein
MKDRKREREKGSERGGDRVEGDGGNGGGGKTGGWRRCFTRSAISEGGAGEGFEIQTGERVRSKELRKMLVKNGSLHHISSVLRGVNF